MANHDRRVPPVLVVSAELDTTFVERFAVAGRSNQVHSERPSNDPVTRFEGAASGLPQNGVTLGRSSSGARTAGMGRRRSNRHR